MVRGSCEWAPARYWDASILPDTRALPRCSVTQYYTASCQTCSAELSGHRLRDPPPELFPPIPDPNKVHSDLTATPPDRALLHNENSTIVSQTYRTPIQSSASTGISKGAYRLPTASWVVILTKICLWPGNAVSLLMSVVILFSYRLFQSSPSRQRVLCACRDLAPTLNLPLPAGTSLVTTCLPFVY